MNKIIFISLLFLFSSCENEKTPLKAFETTDFEVGNFEKRVRLFLIHKQIFNPKTKYFIFNTEGCSSCIENKLNQLTTILINKNGVVFITNKENKLISANYKLYIFPKKTFEEYNIWHSDIYEYSFDTNRQFHSNIVNEKYFKKFTH